MLVAAWTLGSIDFKCRADSYGIHDPGLVADDELRRLVGRPAVNSRRLNRRPLKKDFSGIVATSHEEVLPASTRAQTGTRHEAASGKTPNLISSRCLTENAKKGKIDPVLGPI